MTNSFLVIGLGVFGSSMAKALYDGGAYVLAVDRKEGPVNAVRDASSKAVCCDAINSNAMQAIGAFTVNTAIVALRNHFDATILITHALHKRGIPHILVQVDNAQQAEVIQSYGNIEIIFPPRDMALRIAHRLIHPGSDECVTV
ncbi:MAG: TrkA family potassium uptake protein [Magnetococcales bacterium]|nr:TrkA family potassium uptake protein [Magnetococcales bacterium]